MECLSACKLIWRGAQKDQEPGSHGALKGNSSFLGSKQSRTWELWADWAVSGLLKAAKLCGLPQNWELEASAKTSPVTWQAELPCCVARAGCTAEAVSVCFLLDFTCFISLSEPEVNWVVVFSILVFWVGFFQAFCGAQECHPFPTLGSALQLSQSSSIYCFWAGSRCWRSSKSWTERLFQSNFLPYPFFLW